MLIWFVILFCYTAFVTNVNEYLQMHLSWDAYHQLKHPHNLLCPRFKIPQSTVGCWKVLRLHTGWHCYAHLWKPFIVTLWLDSNLQRFQLSFLKLVMTGERLSKVCCLQCVWLELFQYWKRKSSDLRTNEEVVLLQNLLFGQMSITVNIRLKYQVLKRWMLHVNRLVDVLRGISPWLQLHYGQNQVEWSMPAMEKTLNKL